MVMGCGRSEVRVRLVQLLLTTLEIRVWDLVADLVEVKEGRLEGRVRTTGTLQCFLNKGTEGKTLLVLGALRIIARGPDGFDDNRSRVYEIESRDSGRRMHDRRRIG